MMSQLPTQQAIQTTHVNKPLQARSLRVAVNCLAAILVFYSSASGLANQSFEKISEKQVNEVNLEGSSFSILLQRFAKSSETPIGFEALPQEQKWEQVQTIHIPSVTAASALNMILQTDNRYEWKENEGVINVLPKQGKSPILDVVIELFDINQLDKAAALDALMSTPEAQKVLQQNGARMHTPHSIVGSRPANDSKLISLSTHGETIRSILNKLLLQIGSQYWVFYRYGDHLEYVAINKYVGSVHDAGEWPAPLRPFKGPTSRSSANYI